MELRSNADYALFQRDWPRFARHRRHGVVTLWTLLFVAFLATVLCVVVEIAHLYLARTELENALEAAALAGADYWAQNPTDIAGARTRAQDYAAANTVDGKPVILDTNLGSTDVNLNDSPHGNLILGAVSATPVRPADNAFAFEHDTAPSCPGDRRFAVRAQANIKVTPWLSLLGIPINPFRVAARTTASAGCYASPRLIRIATGQAEGEKVYVSEYFRGTTATGWIDASTMGQGTKLTASLAGGDPDGRGWLRLTDNLTNQSSFTYYNEPIPTLLGLVFTFDFVIWGGGGPTGGDGFALVIFDDTVAPAAGGYGGSLGYSKRDGIPGLAGGVVGIGFDEFGNYSNPTEGRVGGPGRTPNAIAVRGSMGATRNDGYEYTAGTTSLAAFSFPAATQRPEVGIHSARITIRPNHTMTIEWKPDVSQADWVLLLDFTCTLTCPEYVKFGFTAGTGAAKNYHEIRDLQVTSHEKVVIPTDDFTRFPDRFPP